MDESCESITDDHQLEIRRPASQQAERRKSLILRVGIQQPGDLYRFPHIRRAIQSIKFGVKALYLIGSTKNATAGPGSDIDTMLHVAGTDEQRKELLLWLEGWSCCLGELGTFCTAGF